MSTTTAAVETLTAEVRVLMVGSRQVTISVAKQLDTAPLAEVDVFGRIRLSGEERWVIGARKTTGDLVLSSWRRIQFEPPIIDLDDVPEEARPIMCKRLLNGTGRLVHAWLEGSGEIRLERDKVRPCADLQHGMSAWDLRDVPPPNGHYWRTEDLPKCRHWSPEGARATCIEQAAVANARYSELKRINEAAQNAPLIVLAGLR